MLRTQRAIQTTVADWWWRVYAWFGILQRIPSSICVRSKFHSPVLAQSFFYNFDFQPLGTIACWRCQRKRFYRRYAAPHWPCTFWRCAIILDSNSYSPIYRNRMQSNSHRFLMFTGKFGGGRILRFLYTCLCWCGFCCRSYQSTFLYRELKLRSAILASGQLKLLPKEQLYSTLGGIWNLSSDQGNLGTFIVTNVRLIWYADINETFNISLPHMQIGSVSVTTQSPL